MLENYSGYVIYLKVWLMFEIFLGVAVLNQVANIYRTDGIIVFNKLGQPLTPYDLFEIFVCITL